MYDLAGADPALRFSPYCWRTRFALAQKGLAAEFIPWRFAEHEKLAFSGQTRVPVLIDGENVISDSWEIALDLDRRYPDRPALFPGGGTAHALFLNAWADTIILPAIARLIVADIPLALDQASAAYFRASREKALGGNLETIVAGRETRVAAFQSLLLPARRVLARASWLGGDAPDYADYILAGTLMWPRCVSRFPVLAADDPVAAWFGRVLALFDGLGAKAKTVG